MNKKAQLFSMDAMVASAIFVFLLVLIFTFWYSHSITFQKEKEYSLMENKAFSVSNLLISTTGRPSAWEYNLSEPETLGLAYMDKTLKKEKLDTFITLEYSQIKEKLNIEKYKFYFKLKTTEGTILYQAGNFTTAENVISTQRVVLFNKVPHIMEFALWD